MNDTMNDWIEEGELAQRLGLTRREAAALRQKLPADLWRKEKGRVQWSPAGISAGLARLTQGDEQLAGLLEKKAEEWPEETLTVTRWEFPNGQVIECARADGARVLVRVAAARNFRARLFTGAPMTVRARRVRGVWHLSGPCPRWPGKW